MFSLSNIVSLIGAGDVFERLSTVSTVNAFELLAISYTLRMNCIVHQIELIVKCIFDAHFDAHVILKKVLDMISSLRRKKLVVQHLRDKCGGKSLLGLAPHRWGSTSVMLDRFLIVYSQLMEVLFIYFHNDFYYSYF